MKKKKNNKLDRTIQSLVYIVIAIIILALAVYLVYNYYFSTNFSNITAFKETQMELVKLPIISKFKTEDLGGLDYYDLVTGGKLEYANPTKGVSSGQDVPLSPTNIEVVDAKYGETLKIFWLEPEVGQNDFVRIYRSDTKDGQKEVIAENLPMNGSYKDENLTNKQNYFYEVRTVSVLNDKEKESKDNNTYSGVPTDSIAPPAPANVLVTNTGNGHELKVSWSNPVIEDFDHVRIYRSEKFGELDSDGVMIKITNGSEYYIDTDVKDNIVYYYTVTAVDVFDNESPKNFLVTNQGNPDPFNFKSVSIKEKSQ